jgi:hypothetical protein
MFRYCGGNPADIDNFNWLVALHMPGRSTAAAISRDFREFRRNSLGR